MLCQMDGGILSLISALYRLQGSHMPRVWGERKREDMAHVSVTDVKASRGLTLPSRYPITRAHTPIRIYIRVPAQQGNLSHKLRTPWHGCQRFPLCTGGTLRRCTACVYSAESFNGPDAFRGPASAGARNAAECQYQEFLGAGCFSRKGAPAPAGHCSHDTLPSPPLCPC